MIGGIININTSTKYGFTKKKIPIYKFMPLDYNLPNYYVPSSMKGKNKFVIIKPTTLIYNKLLMGEIYINIGDIDDINAQYDILLYKYNLKFKQLSYNNDIDDEILEPIDIYAFSIDPVNCKDIDDALSISNNNHTIGIHIADVSHYINNLDFERLFSIYFPNKTINMLPNILSENKCSLLENTIKRTLTLWLYLNDNDKIINYKFEQVIIKNSKQFNYDEADKYFIGKPIYELSKKLAYEFNIKTDLWDTHKMVEIYMLCANKYAAIQLKDNPNTIFRIQEKMYNINIIEKIIGITNSNKAIYSYNNIGHSSLNLEYYTHFTSPIRRIVDIYIHQLLKGQNPKKIDIQNINLHEKKIKKIYNDISLIKLIHEIDEKKRLEFYIIDVDLFKINIYIPSYKIFYKYKIFTKDIHNLYTIINEDKFVKYIDTNNNELLLYKYILLNAIFYPKYDKRSLYIDFQDSKI